MGLAHTLKLMREIDARRALPACATLRETLGMNNAASQIITEALPGWAQSLDPAKMRREDVKNLVVILQIINDRIIGILGDVK